MSGEHPLPNPRECEIFCEALKLTSLEKRAEYLNGACGDDDALRASVEDLLKHCAEDDPVEDFARGLRSSVSVGEKIGDTIGNFKLLKVIGEGGCGVVYLAEQEQTLHRHVALKVIKMGMDTDEVIRRFESERRVLADLTHSSIARVYEAGSTTEGRPYFIMELVKGEKITSYADSHRLTICQRLKLFVKVCQAVDYANEKGIIHRDIKPSNILVTEENGEPLPKVIDFGIAKAMVDNQGRDQRDFTLPGQFIGTPAYSSPEQANCSQKQSIDKRTDVYSLGVLLYELLVGCLPLSVNGAEAKDQLLAICSITFPTPSAKFETLGKSEMSSVVQSRQIERFAFVKILRRGLDRIVMKCLEKDPESRYQTANSIAADIQVYLKGEDRSESTFAVFSNRKSFLYIIAILLIATVAWKVFKPLGQKDFLVNKGIFLQVEKAVNAPTFEGAQLILDQVDAPKITDGDLASYFSICKEIADFSVQVGIPRNGTPSWHDILRDVDLIKLAEHAFRHPIETTQKAKKIKKELPDFEQLEQTLIERYGDK